MTLFRNQVHQEIWVENWCHRCYEPHEAARRIQGKDTMCPIIKRALANGRKPHQWDRTRATDMAKSIRCNEFQPSPPTTIRPKAEAEDVPMFDVNDQTLQYVPVEGWPDRPRTKGNEVDHA